VAGLRVDHRAIPRPKLINATIAGRDPVQAVRTAAGSVDVSPTLGLRLTRGRVGDTLVVAIEREEADALPTDPSHSASVHVAAGSVVGLWRYPVKSMMGEELNATEVTARGLVSDRQFAVVDGSTGKVGGAKNPRKWGNFFDFRAAYGEPPQRGSKLPPSA
jgi:hypothetical protein